MTDCTRIIKRLTAVATRGRPLTIELHPLFLVLRPKGLKTGYVLDYDAAFDLAQKLAVRRKTVKALPLLGEAKRVENIGEVRP